MTYLFWDVRHPSLGQSSRRGPPGRGLREAEAQNNQCRLASMMGLLTEAAAVNGLDAKSLEFWRAQELTDFHRVTTAVQLPTAPRWRRPQRCCVQQAVLCRRLLLADAVQVVVVGDDEAGAEETLAMDHLSASFWRAKRCLLQQSVKDEAIHRSNSHLDHRKAGEEGGTLGGASNKKRWWKKIVPSFLN